MIYNYSNLFMLFFMYSFMGYFVEVISASITNKKFSLSRGFLIGPYLPVYGIGALIITLFISKYSNDYIAVFILGMVISCIVEYFTSYILEKTFDLRWWDYSKKKFNLNGRICLSTGIKFGFCSIFVIKIGNPFLFKLFKCFSPKNLLIVSIVLSVVILIDTIMSNYIISSLKIDTKKYFKKDATEEIKNKVRESLSKYRVLYTRLLKAFPYLSLENRKFDKIIKLIRRNK